MIRELPVGSYRIHGTDRYFYQNGQYRFDPDLLPQNHKLNQQAFFESLRKEIPLVICDNTNLHAWQRKPYVEMAVKHGYDIELVKIGLLYDDALQALYASRNSHGVSRDVIIEMLETKAPSIE